MLRMPSKNDRVLMLIALMATASFAVGGVVYAMSASNAAELQTSAARIAELNGLATRLSNDVNEEEAALGDYVVSRSPISLARYNEAVRDEDAAADAFRAAAVGVPSTEPPLEALMIATNEWRTRVAEPALRARLPCSSRFRMIATSLRRNPQTGRRRAIC